MITNKKTKERIEPISENLNIFLKSHLQGKNSKNEKRFQRQPLNTVI